MRKPDPYYLSKEWRALRKRVLERDGYRCVVCREHAAIVDHILRRKDGGKDEPGNLRSLCRAHDNQIKERPNGKRANGGKSKLIGCGPDGWPYARQ